MIFNKILALLILPILLCSCARAQGAAAPTGRLAGAIYTPTQADDLSQVDIENSFLPQVEVASFAPIINYVDSLNWALAGDLSKLKKAAHPGCGCLEISSRLAKLFTTASLSGGGYRLAKLAINSDSLNKKSFDVVIHRSDLIKINKSSGVRQLWQASIISNLFVVEKIGGIWQLTQVVEK